MTPETRAEFKDIVLKGTRTAKGMAGFADVVTEEEVEAINAYLIARASEDWNR